jgi:hypothetical protein
MAASLFGLALVAAAAPRLTGAEALDLATADAGSVFGRELTERFFGQVERGARLLHAARYVKNDASAVLSRVAALSRMHGPPIGTVVLLLDR